MQAEIGSLAEQLCHRCHQADGSLTSRLISLCCNCLQSAAALAIILAAQGQWLLVAEYLHGFLGNSADSPHWRSVLYETVHRAQREEAALTGCQQSSATTAAPQQARQVAPAWICSLSRASVDAV